jgi:hypothetical protein
MTDRKKLDLLMSQYAGAFALLNRIDSILDFDIQEDGGYERVVCSLQIKNIL